MIDFKFLHFKQLCSYTVIRKCVFLHLCSCSNVYPTIIENKNQPHFTPDT